MNITPIGFVKSEVVEQTDTNWGNTISEIVLNKDLQLGLFGLESFSHAIIVFYMDKSSFELESDLVRFPQGRSDLPKVGIFSQRAKHRPNPIGITAVKILEITDNILKVQGLDAINNTPVIDIKPYFTYFDQPKEEIKMPQWVNQIMGNYF